MEVTTIPARMLRNSCGLFLKDLEALPAEAFTRKFGDKTRTVADIVYEVNLVNDHIGMFMRGEPPFEWPEGAYIFAPEGFKDKDMIIEAFKASSERIVSTAASYTDEELEAPLLTDEGQTTRAERCRFMSLHIWYHSGQVNFIQTLLGDDRFNWA